MRIGEFAKKHNITQDTIRHYLDLGLLVTEKEGGQFKFNESDSKDLRKILELKQLEFPLVEVKKILTVQRLCGDNTELCRKSYLACLEEKKKEITEEIKKYQTMKSILNDKVHELKSHEGKKSSKLGIPISSLGILACPQCQNNLEILNGVIDDNMIIKANIHCSCGYLATIEDGVFIYKKSLRTKMLNGRRMQTKEEYLASCSYNYVTFLYKGMKALIEQIHSYAKESKYILELNNCVGFFLMQYIKYLPRDTTYTLVDYDKERMFRVKKELEMYYEHKNFLFLCCDYHNLPLKPSSIDIEVDFGMIRAYQKDTGEYLPDKVIPLLKESGLYTSSFSYLVDKDSVHRGKDLNINDYLNKDIVLKKLENSHLKELDMKDIGPYTKDHPYNSQGSDKDLYQAIYTGRKRAVTIQCIKPNQKKAN